MLNAEVMRQIRRIQLRTKRMADELLQGSYHSAFKGSGMEFDQVREYAPGDDIRLLDWNVTARMDHPFVKQFVEEREVTVMLLVDISASGAFGSSRLKRETAAEFAAVIALSAIQNKDKVGLLLFSDRVERFIPPRKGRDHVWRVIREVLTHRPERQGTDLNAGLNYLNNVVKRKSVAFLVSDFLAEGFERAVRLSNRRHDLIAVPVSDPRERELPAVGLLELRDPETGAARLVDTGSAKTRAAFRQAQERREAALRDTFRRAGVDALWVRTDEPYILPLVRLFQRRGHRR